MGYKMKGYSYPGKSPAKQKPKKSTVSAHGQLSDAEADYQADLKKKKLDHIGTGFMNPPYKDTVKLQKAGVPYEKRQGYHGFKDFDSILNKEGKKSPAKHTGHTDVPHTHKMRPETDTPERVLSDEEMSERDKGGGLDYYISYPTKKEQRQTKRAERKHTRAERKEEKRVDKYIKKEEKSKKKRSKVKRTKRPKARKVKNLVTGGYNILR